MTSSSARADGAPSLPRRRYRPRLLVEVLSELVLVGILLVGMGVLVSTRSLSGALLGSAVLTVASMQAILLFHDCMHQSAFGRRRLETWLARLIGAFYGCPFHFLRAEHLSHHRHAGLVDDDPEALHLAEADAARRPMGTLLMRIAHRAGDAFLYTWVLQIGQFARWVARQVRHCDDRELARATAIDLACTLALWLPLSWLLVENGVYGRVLLFGFLLPALAGLAIVYAVAKPLHRLMIPFRLSGLPYAQRQLAVSRSFETHPLLSLLVCNLNHHIEHHLYPHVSRWDLPRLARELRPALVAFARAHDLPLAVHDGYLSWARRHPRLPSEFNPIEEWNEWALFNQQFEYVCYHAPERR